MRKAFKHVVQTLDARVFSVVGSPRSLRIHGADEVIHVDEVVTSFFQVLLFFQVLSPRDEINNIRRQRVTFVFLVLGMHQEGSYLRLGVLGQPVEGWPGLVD
jgi:hypothetical protein